MDAIGIFVDGSGYDIIYFIRLENVWREDNDKETIKKFDDANTNNDPVHVVMLA